MLWRMIVMASRSPFVRPIAPARTTGLPRGSTPDTHRGLVPVLPSAAPSAVAPGYDPVSGPWLGPLPEHGSRLACGTRFPPMSSKPVGAAHPSHGTRRIRQAGSRVCIDPRWGHPLICSIGQQEGFLDPWDATDGIGRAATRAAGGTGAGIPGGPVFLYSGRLGECHRGWRGMLITSRG